MITIDSKQIESLCISPSKCVDWVTQSFQMKGESQLPAKMSVHPTGNDFFTTMPCLLPPEKGRFGVKVVSRILGRTPSLSSDILLYNSSNGELLALINADWITSMRTGAVATLAIKTLRTSSSWKYAFIGLGNTAKSTLLCLLCHFPDELFHITLFRYKDQAERFVDYFKAFGNVAFEIVDTLPQLVEDADVLVSCITDAHGILVEDVNLFKPGVLLVPVHTRGFQNCDLFFDKVFADDTEHVKNFRYFNQFRQFNELGEVLNRACQGRGNDEERILSYNIGLGLHDIFFASNIYDMIINQ